MWEENFKKGRNQSSQKKVKYEAQQKSVLAAKKAMKGSLRSKTILDWNTRVQKLTFQGDFIKFLIDEKENMAWQSISNKFTKRVL